MNYHAHITRGSLWFLLLLISISLQFAPVFCDDSKIVAKAENHSSTSRRTGSMVIIALVVFSAVALVSYFLFRLWQKKKRDEQYARLLKLFEEDDELELELGLRD